MNHHFSSSTQQRILYGLIAFIVALFVFHVGERVGYHKASFAFRGGDNYYRAFEQRDHLDMSPRFPDAHGAAGKVISATTTSLVVEDRDGTEKTIAVSAETIVKNGRDTATAGDIKAGDFVIVIGSPDDTSSINAKLIRIMPAPAAPQSKQAQ